MLRIHACEKCVARRICLSPRRYPRLSVSSFENGRIPSTSQHVCRDSFHDNEDHAWHKGHSFQPKTTMPRLPASRAKGVSLSSTRVMACGSMLSSSPSGTGFIARSLWRSWRPCLVAVLSDWLRFPLESCVFVFQRAQGEKFSPHLFNYK